MVSAFGLGPSNQPRSDVMYLDLRAPTAAGWAWKSSWSSEMLGAYSGSSSQGTTGSNPPSGGTLAAIIVPVVLGALLAIPLMIYFVRRHMRTVRKRRMAQHFSFEDQEDSGVFRKPLNLLGRGRKTKTQYSFGQDANEKEGSVMSDMAQGFVSLLRKSSGNSSDKRSSKSSQLTEKDKKWEEIDFGLGKLDEQGRVSRRSSFSATGSPVERNGNKTPEPLPFPMPMTHSGEYDRSSLFVTGHSAAANQHLSVGSPIHDGQAPLVPSMHLIPATPSMTTQLASYPAMQPAPSSVSASHAQAAALDWAALQRDLEAKPAFRSISPTSPLRSHAHDSPPRVSSITYKPSSPSPPSIPPLSFDTHTSAPTQTDASMITINPRTGRRTSATSITSNRVVSQPQASTRQLAGAAFNTGRRGSAPSIDARPLPHVPGARRGSVASLEGRRASAGSLHTLDGRRGSGASQASRLRVVNPSPDSDAEEQSSTGLAL